MRLRRHSRSEISFDWREITCEDEATAKREAERRQAEDDPRVAEWIYLHSDTTGEWLARRVPRDPAMYRERSRTPLWEALLDNLFS
jgi:hypothetical protein